MPARTPENSMAGPSRSLASRRESAAWIRGVQCGHDFLGLAHNRVQVGLILEAFRINLIDALGARRPRRKPAAGRYDLQATYRGVVSRVVGQLGFDRLTTESRCLYGLRRQLPQLCLLLGRCWRVDACVIGHAEFRG